MMFEPVAPVRRGYVDTRAGQVHVRTCGSGRPVVLLHWTPASGRQYEAVLPRLAAQGWRAIAPDLMGYGRSDPRPGDWTVADFAANVAEVAEALDAGDAPVVGGHFAACVAVELALESRVPCLVLDGVPLWSAAMRERMAAFVAGAPPRVTVDGSHRTLAWERVLAFVREWCPGFEPADADLPWLHGLMIDFLETRGASSAYAMARCDLAARLPLLAVPTGLLVADADPLAGNHARVRELLPDAATHRFAGGHPLHEVARAGEWAAAVHAFLQDHRTGGTGGTGGTNPARPSAGREPG